jgi:hypothetical protein
MVDLHSHCQGVTRVGRRMWCEHELASLLCTCRVAYLFRASASSRAAATAAHSWHPRDRRHAAGRQPLPLLCRRQALFKVLPIQSHSACDCAPVIMSFQDSSNLECTTPRFQSCAAHTDTPPQPSQHNGDDQTTPNTPMTPNSTAIPPNSATSSSPSPPTSAASPTRSHCLAHGGRLIECEKEYRTCCQRPEMASRRLARV